MFLGWYRYERLGVSERHLEPLWTTTMAPERIVCAQGLLYLDSPKAKSSLCLYWTTSLCLTTAILINTVHIHFNHHLHKRANLFIWFLIAAKRELIIPFVPRDLLILYVVWTNYIVNPSNAEATFQSTRMQRFLKNIETLSCWYSFESSR